MLIYLNILLLQSFPELDCTTLSCKLRNDNAAYIESFLLKLTDQTQYIHIICDAKVSPDFVLFNICRTDYNDNLCYIRKLHQHL